LARGIVRHILPLRKPSQAVAPQPTYIYFRTMATKREIPWCTVFLCGTALLCHTMVLTGNMMTSLSVLAMGKSVKGWSEVGLAVSDALHEELDGLLGNVTFQLTEAIQRTVETQELIDEMLSMMGGQAEKTALLEVKNLTLVQGGRALVHARTGEVVENPFDAIMKVIMKVFKALPSFQDGLESLQSMMANLKPALMQVGIWVETFADKVQASVEAFGTTLDRVQKIFDHVMAQLSPSAGEGADLMQHETFNLFDVDSSGMISEDDLHTCAELYAVPTLSGDKGKDLIKTYDANGNGEIDTQEFANLVEDSSIVGIMATVLRAYAKRLSIVAGTVGAGRLRDEVASNVVKYFQLVSSKNLTKVGWVSEMLTNGTLPIEFTADVMAELALQSDDPNVLTTADVGEVVIGMMATLNQAYTMKAFDLMTTAEHWTSEGFEPDDHQVCTRKVTHWLSTGPAAVAELEKNMVELQGLPDDRPALDAGSDYSFEDEELSNMIAVFEAMPKAAAILTEERMHEHRAKIYRKRAKRRLDLFGTEEKSELLVELLHGVAATDGGPTDRATQALNRGVPAKPETLLFASWLSANATSTANRFQKMCFDYTGESSNALDAFNSQIQGMVKKLSGFIDIMKRYATPAGIDNLEQKVMDFASNAMEDVFEIVADKVLAVLDSSQDLHQLRHLRRDLLEPVTVETRDETPQDILQHWMNVAETMKEKYSAPRSYDVEEHYERWRKKYPAHGFDVRQNHTVALLEFNGSVALRRGFAAGRRSDSSQPPAGMSGIWEQVSNMLRELEQVLPTAIDILKFARKEVSGVAATLESIFSTLEEKGVPIFAEVAFYWQFLWVFYYFFVMPLTIGILFYGFWAGGFFGGPSPFEETGAKDEEYVAPQTCWEYCCCCCNACCNCLRRCQDRQLCFWSFIIVFQIIVFLLFIVFLVFVLVGGVQIFTGTSCAQIYILGDTKVCTETLGMLATFLSTFIIHDGEIPLSMSCDHYNLKTCDLIRNKMLQSTILTVVGSFVAAVLSFQMIFATAVQHERAVWRRMINRCEALAEVERS